MKLAAAGVADRLRLRPFFVGNGSSRYAFAAVCGERRRENAHHRRNFAS